jgi:hypothetical protein
MVQRNRLAITYSKNITGRSFDIDWFHILETSQAGEVNFMFNNRSRKLTGLEKMIQKWTLLFLTPQGSDPFEPDLGTDFYRVLESSSGDEGYISNIVNSAISDASEQIEVVQSEVENLPEDETFSAAALISISVVSQTLDVRIQLVNAQGESRIYTLPVPLENSPI